MNNGIDKEAIEKKKEKIRSKYSALLEGFNGVEGEEKEDMEITFTAGTYYRNVNEFFRTCG